MGGTRFGRWAGILAVMLGMLVAGTSVAVAQDDEGASALAQWARRSGDTRGWPFAVVDKPNARLFVFAADGALLGSSPVLLGMTRGDEASAPDIAKRLRTTGIPVEQRTTPAGRFDAVPGRNDRGEAIVWVDYGAALAIHRLRPAPLAERRPQRLASPAVDDNRISLGCIVVAEVFYDAVVAPHLGRQRSVVYVLPDSRHWTEQFRDAVVIRHGDFGDAAL
jgi:hypothetical protein